MKKDDRVFLGHIRREISLLNRYSSEITFDNLIENPLIQHFVQKAMENIGEAVKQISDGTKSQCPSIEWDDLRKMRNRLTHEYFSIDWDYVWDVLTTVIPRLKKCVDILLKD